MRAPPKPALVLWLALLAIGDAIASPPRSAVAQGVALDAEQQAMLETLDQPTVARALQLAALVPQWQSQIEGAAADPAKRRAVVYAVVSELQKAAQASPLIQQAVQYPQRLAPILQEAEQKWRQAQYVAAEYPGFTAANFREEARRRAETAAAEQLQEVCGQTIFPALLRLRDPAAYVQGFADGKFREWLSQPLPLDDEGTLTAKILPPPPNTPLLSSQARFEIEIEYLPQDLVVRAKGLRFRYEPGQAAPEPVLDDLVMEADFEQTVLNNVKALGQDLVASADMPIKVTLRDKPDFRTVVAGQRGGLRFDVEVGLFTGGTVKAKAEGLVLFPGNKLDWADAKLTIDVPLEPPVPIGTTPFAFWSMRGGLAPKTKALTVGTQIGSAATPPSVVGLDVSLETSLPIKQLTLQGHLIVATQKMLEAKGTIDFEQGLIEGEFTGGTSPLSQLLLTKGKFSLRRERFVCDGEMKILGQDFVNMHCEIDLQTGAADLYANGDFELFGADFGASLEAHVEPGFEAFTLAAVGSVEVDGIAPYGEISVSVEVQVDSRKDLPVTVIAKTFDPSLDVTFSLPLLSECTLVRLRKEIGGQAAQAYHRLLRALADADEDTRRLGAKMDEQTRDWVNDNLGIRWETGIPELDQLGGDLSREFQNVGGAWHDLTQGVGGAAGELGQNVGDGLSNLEEQGREELSNLDPTTW